MAQADKAAGTMADALNVDGFIPAVSFPPQQSALNPLYHVYSLDCFELS